MIENKIFKKKNFLPKTASGEALFLPLVKAKNQLPNFFYLFKKSGEHGEKRKNTQFFHIS